MTHSSIPCITSLKMVALFSDGFILLMYKVWGRNMLYFTNSTNREQVPLKLLMHLLRKHDCSFLHVMMMKVQRVFASLLIRYFIFMQGWIFGKSFQWKKGPGRIFYLHHTRSVVPWGAAPPGSLRSWTRRCRCTAASRACWGSAARYTVWSVLECCKDKTTEW